MNIVPGPAHLAQREARKVRKETEAFRPLTVKYHHLSRALELIARAIEAQDHVLADIQERVRNLERDL
jgi:formate dehydrogenase maturation protein FdhE